MKVKLKDLGKISTGNTPSKNIPEFYNSEDIGFVKPDMISEQQINFIENTTEYLAEAARNKARIAKKNAVFVTCIGSIGKVGIVKNKELAFNQQINAIEPNEKVLPQYLSYGIFANKRRLQTISNAPVVPIINKTQFGEFEIDINNDTKEQLKVVELLDKVSGVIANRREELEKLDDLIKARFVEMFGEPIANQMKWPVKTLRELSEVITNGNTPKGGAENYVEHGIQFIRSQNVWRNRLDMSDVVYIDQETHESMRKSSVHHNDILITKTGRINTENSSLGRAALYTGEDNMANINGHVYLIRLKENVNPEYVLTILTGEAYRDYIRKVCVGGIDKRQINLEHVERFPIILPPDDMIHRFVSFKQEIDKLKVAVQKALEETQLLFDSLMQKYFG